MDWSVMDMDHDDVTISDDGKYTCVHCGSVLEATGGVDRSGDWPEEEWRCDECGEEYWFSHIDLYRSGCDE